MFIKINFIVGMLIIFISIISNIISTQRDSEKLEEDMNDILGTVSSYNDEDGKELSSLYSIFKKFPFIIDILTCCLGFIPVINIIILVFMINGLKNKLVKRLWS